MAAPAERLAPPEHRIAYPNVIVGAALDGEREYAADAVVVGTGAGGATAAARLRDAGLDVVMLEEGALLVHHEVARAGEPGERLVVVAPELVAPARRATEALLEERERRQRVLAVEDDLAQRRRVGRHEVGQGHGRRACRRGVEPRLQARPGEGRDGRHPLPVREPVQEGRDRGTVGRVGTDQRDQVLAGRAHANLIVGARAPRQPRAKVARRGGLS